MIKCEILIYHTMNETSMHPLDADNEYPTIIWNVFGDMVSGALSYTTKTKRPFDAVLFQIHNFRSWFIDSVYKEIMFTLHGRIVP